MALSTSTQALDEIFKKLMLNAGVTAPGVDQVESIRGTKREQWAFPEGQMNPVNVTPFQDRSLDEQKALGLVLSQIYGHGAGYEQAEAMKSSAAASLAHAAAAQSQAGAANTNAATNKKALDELLKRNAEAKTAETVAGSDDYEGMPPWAPPINKPTNKVAVPTGSARTTGGAALSNDALNFEMTPEKLAALGAGTVLAQKKKKKTGNLWEDSGYGSFVSTMK